jgi:hypothetical protein
VFCVSVMRQKRAQREREKERERERANNNSLTPSSVGTVSDYSIDAHTSDSES